MEFNNIHRLAKVKGYMDSLVKGAIETQLHPTSTETVDLCSVIPSYNYSSSTITQPITIEAKRSNLQTLPTNCHWLASNYELGRGVGI
jgi:hypothetical protein